MCASIYFQLSKFLTIRCTEYTISEISDEFLLREYSFKQNRNICLQKVLNSILKNKRKSESKIKFLISILLYFFCTSLSIEFNQSDFVRLFYLPPIEQKRPYFK